MSPIPRQILLHVAGGFVVAALFVATLTLTGAGAVLRAAPPGPLLLLWVFCGTTFGVALGASAMQAPDVVRARRPRR